MSSIIMLIESSSTVSRMVEIALTGLSVQLRSAEAEEELSDALSRLKPELILVGTGADELALALKSYGETGSQIPVIIGLGDECSVEGNGHISGSIPLPFETGHLVSTVYEALGQEVPDEAFLQSRSSRLPLVNASPPEAVVEASHPEVSEAEVAKEAVEEGVEEGVEETDASAEPQATTKGTISLPVDDLDILEESILEEAAEFAEESLEELVEQEVQSAVASLPLPAPDEGSRVEVEALTRRVIEEVVWEVVPRLAEALLKEEIARVVRERMDP